MTTTMATGWTRNAHAVDVRDYSRAALGAVGGPD
jgi:hypothetical protein